MSSWILLCCLFVLSKSAALPMSGSQVQGRNLVQFANMIELTLSMSAFNFNGYGCWCGAGGAGKPVDEIDACCKVHDDCYDDIINDRSSFLECSPYLSFYSWDIDSKALLPYCKDAPGTCASKVCQCDRAATHCYKRNIHKFNKFAKCPK